MLNEYCEEVERLLDDLGAGQSENGDRLVTLPCGAVLTVTLEEDSPDLYAEAAVCEIDEEKHAASRYARIASLNLFWRELDGFSAAFRGRTLYVETRESMARLADDEDFRQWLLAADGAVQTAYAVATAPTGVLANQLFETETEENGPEENSAESSAEDGVTVRADAMENGVMIWP